ncbi:MAG: PepSY-associated TM helix domain-containing protein [Gammaproteobacteria bacterium]
MNTQTIKTWYVVHKCTSLICTVLLLMLCITGLPLIFGHEIHHAFEDHVEPRAMPASTPRINLDAIIADAKGRRPQDFMQFVSTDEDEPNVWHVGMGETADAPEVTVFYTYDARSGDLLETWTPQDPQGFMDVVFRLHYDLYAGLPGTLFLGAMGLLLVVSLVSGAVVYGPFMRRLSFGTVRKEKSSRAKWLDLHNLLGIATLTWVLVVGATGVINTLAIPIFGYWQNTDLADMAAPYRNQPPLMDSGSAQRAVSAAQAAAPDMRLSFISFPGNDSASPHHYVAYMNGQTPLTSKLMTPLLIDARSSAVVDTREMPWYVTALLVSQPLHFGDYGGLPLKILWGLLDLIAIVVLGSGLYLWWVKRNVAFETRLNTAQWNDVDDVVPRVSARQGTEA